MNHNTPHYSVIIRTLTGGGGYYPLLMQSINAQTIQPKNVYIIQPNGYATPEFQIGFEKYIHCEKGMWSQRIFGMEYCYEQPLHSKYLLVLDDDVEFESDFAEKLITLAERHGADCLIPIQDKQASKLQNFISTILGRRSENKHSKYKITIKRNGSFSVNNSLKQNVNPTQSGIFQCFLMRTDITPKLELRDEMWLDETRYAWPDDQVFFYKAHLCGFNVLSCKQPTFKHNDGKSGVTSKERAADAAFSASRNSYIFVKKFIKNKSKSKFELAIVNISHGYHNLMNGILYFLMGLRNKDLDLWRSYRRGIVAGKAYTKTHNI